MAAAAADRECEQAAHVDTHVRSRVLTLAGEES